MHIVWLLQVLQGHSSPVSYVRFLRHQLVTASVDSTLGWWDLGSSHDSFAPQPSNAELMTHRHDSASAVRRLRTMRGHANTKNFVGLSVREHDGLIACGSEAGQAYAYHTSWDEPVACAHVLGSQQSDITVNPLSSSLQQQQQQQQVLQGRGTREPGRWGSGQCGCVAASCLSMATQSIAGGSFCQWQPGFVVLGGV